jgi:hypothetical protein
MLSTDRSTGSEEILSAFIEQLERDSRVSRVERPDTDPRWSERRRWWLPFNSGDPPDLTGGRDQFVGVEWTSPVSLTVNVPAKNQKTYASDETAPAEIYEVLWDGLVVVVGWAQDTDDLGLAGGQVVEEVLHDAAHQIDQHIHVQSCAPHCDYLFVHANLRGTRGDVEELVAIGKSGPYEPVEFTAPDDVSVRSTTEDIFWSLKSDLRRFAKLKNVGRRLLEIESFAQTTLDSLLGRYQADAEYALLPWYARARGLREIRRSRRRARRDIATMWLCLASLEKLRRKFSEHARDHRDWQSVFSAEMLLEHDLDELEIVTSMDLSILRQGTEHAAERLDNRSVAHAPAWGAVAGGVMGAIFGHFL